MAPSAIAEHAVAEVQNKVVVPKPIERIPLPKLEAKGKARPLEDHGEIQPAFPFSKAVLLDENRFKSGSRALRLAVSILLHVTVITDRKSTRLNSSHVAISYAVFCLKKKKKKKQSNLSQLIIY